MPKGLKELHFLGPEKNLKMAPAETKLQQPQKAEKIEDKNWVETHNQRQQLNSMSQQFQRAKNGIFRT